MHTQADKPHILDHELDKRGDVFSLRSQPQSRGRRPVVQRGDHESDEKGDVFEMIELDPRGFAAVQELLRPFEYSLSVRAALEGYNPGRFFVDDPDRPRTVLAITGEGTFLADDPSDPTIIEPLRRLLRRIFTGTVFPSAKWCISLHVDRDEWAAELPRLVPTHQADELLNYHYLCRDLKLDWHAQLPDGYTVQRVDPATLARFPEEMREWGSVEDWWDTVEHFFSKGISFCVVHGDDVVSWCPSTCVTGDQVEVGIFTASAHRRRGLATAAVAATVACCLNDGYRAVGWHCVHDNAGSWKTAEKVGFEREREYRTYYYIFELPDHLSQLAWSCFKRGEYVKTAQYYEQVFSLRQDHPDYYYNCAAEAWGALGDREMALKYLRRAVENGWAAYDYTAGVERFRFLHGTPEWEAILIRIRQNAS
jgi:RimJ/RimL family protein N-acetyltransferase